MSRARSSGLGHDRGHRHPAGGPPTWCTAVVAFVACVVPSAVGAAAGGAALVRTVHSLHKHAVT